MYEMILVFVDGLIVCSRIRSINQINLGFL